MALFTILSSWLCNMKIKVDIDYKKVTKITEAHIKAAGKTAGKMRSLIIADMVIPFKSGDLQNVFTDVDVTKAKQGEVSIIHDGPYAARLYYNPQYTFSKLKNAKARGEWWKEYISGSKKEFARKTFMFYYKKEAGI